MLQHFVGTYVPDFHRAVSASGSYTRAIRVEINAGHHPMMLVKCVHAIVAGQIPQLYRFIV
jgi:hypothetical protein